MDSITNLLTTISEFFTFERIVTSLALLAGGFGAPQFWATWKERQQKQILEKEFGSTFFSRDINHLTTRYYVRPDCSNIDPSREESAEYLTGFTAKLFDQLDDFLSKKSVYRHMIILADSGMGKTSVLLNYYLHNQERSRHKRHRIALIPLGFSEADEYIQSIENPRQTVLFLDAFDEDTKAIEDHQARLHTLMGYCDDFSHVVLTCRTQFFPTEEEVPAETGILRVGPRGLGQGAIYKFQKIYLKPLTNAQVNQYLRKRYPIWCWRQRRKARELVQKIPDLRVRPMLLTFIPDILTTNPTEIEHTFEIYEALVEAWIMREDYWAKPESLREISKRLAVDIFVNREERSQERIHHTELENLAQEWQIPLEKWQITGRSLLNRDAEGNYKFAHRSIMEYLFLCAETAQLDIEWQNIELTYQIQSFVEKIISAERFALLRTLIGVNLSGVDLSMATLRRANFSKAHLFQTNFSRADISGTNFSGANLSEANLSRANLSGANFSGTNLIGTNLEKANLSEVNFKGADLLRARLSDAELYRTRYDVYTKWPSDFEYLKSGAIGPQADLSGVDLERTDLSGCDLSGATLYETNLRKARLRKTNLQRSNLIRANLEGANLEGANLEETDLSGANLSDVDISGTNLTGTILYETNLTGACLRKTNLEGAYLTRVNLTEANLEGARYDFNTKWPSNFNYQDSGAIGPRANFAGVNLEGINLEGASLEGANFSY